MKLTHIGAVKLGTQSYRLVQPEGKQAWQESSLGEPPWSDGLPHIISEPQETWHMGGLKSQAGFPGTSEYGQNTDTRFPFRLLPGPSHTIVTLTGATGPVTSIFEALGRIFACGGRHIFRVNPADDSVVDSKDLGAGVLSVEGLKWEGDEALVTTDAADQSLWRLTALATPDVWSQAAVGIKPYRLAAGIDRLFGVQKNGLLRNVVSGLSPLVAINWADRIQCGATDTIPTKALAFEKTVLVGKPEGLFGVSPEGKGIPVISRIVKDSENFLGSIIAEPYAILPHSRGVYRFVPGIVESIGLERELMNQSPVRGKIYAAAIDGPWLLLFVYTGADTYLVVARERSGGATFGPLMMDTLWYQASIKVQAAYISTSTTPPRLWFGYGNNIAYIKLSSGAGAPDVEDTNYRFVTSGKRFTHKYRFEDWGNKDFPKVDIVGKNLTATRYWEVYWSVDGGAYSNLDKDGAVMRIDTNGRRTFLLPITAVGREVQFRLDYIGSAATAFGEILYFEPYAVPQSRKIPVHTVYLHLGRDDRTDMGIEPRSAPEQFLDLQALEEAAAPVAAFGPWGENQSMWVRKLSLVEVLQESDREQEFLVELVLQEREA